MDQDLKIKFCKFNDRIVFKKLILDSLDVLLVYVVKNPFHLLEWYKKYILGH